MPEMVRHHFIDYIRLTTFIQQKSYLNLLFDIILNILYIKIHFHIEYSINNIENNKTIYFTILLDFNSTIVINDNRIKTSEPYQNIGDTDTFAYIGVITEKHLETICDTEDIKFVATIETSNAFTKTSDSDKAIVDTEKSSNDIVENIVYNRIG